jgi:hypothetical protein
MLANPGFELRLQGEEMTESPQRIAVKSGSDQEPVLS